MVTTVMVFNSGNRYADLVSNSGSCYTVIAFNSGSRYTAMVSNSGKCYTTMCYIQQWIERGYANVYYSI